MSIVDDVVVGKRRGEVSVSVLTMDAEGVTLLRTLLDRNYFVTLATCIR